MEPELLEATPTYDVKPAGDSRPAMAGYVLYLVAIFTAIPSLVAVVLAYIYRDGAPDWLQTHYQYQIRTFWIMCLYLVIGGLTWIFIVGWFILGLVPFWVGARCLLGLQALQDRRPISRPQSWLF
jgi:uncharacterized membrane protein